MTLSPDCTSLNSGCRAFLMTSRTIWAAHPKADVTITMTKDFAITDLNVASPEFVSSIRPRFAKLPDGWLLNAYEASYRSAKPEEATELKVAVNYGAVNGLQTIQKLALGGTYGGSAFNVELAFADCNVTKRH